MDASFHGPSRRGFILWSAAGAFLLAAPGRLRAQSQALTPWIRIAPDGAVSLFTTASDLGQGSPTGQAQILADELDVPWHAVSVEMAPDGKPFLDEGQLMTGGSRSIRTRYQRLREAGALARCQLVAAAANRWRVPAADCQAVMGQVRHAASGRAFAYGALAAEAAALQPPHDPPLKTAAERRYVGKSIAMIGLADKTTGKAAYGIDVRRPGMKFASLVQPPGFGADLAGVDDAAARATPGVLDVISLPKAAVVVATNSWAAIAGARALKPDWSAPSQAIDSAAITARLQAAFDAPSARADPAKNGADIRTRLRVAYAVAPRKLEATYELPFLSHSPLEPMNATAEVTPDKVEIWAPTQVQTRVRRDVAKAVKCSPDDIVLHTTLSGGGFGRRLKTDYAVLAAKVAEKVGGPVQLLWTREEDLTHDFYRPAAVLSYRAALGQDGLPAGLEMVGATANDEAFGAAGPAPYRIDPFVATQTRVSTGVPIGAWRSVDASITNFAKECFIDECAFAAGKDALAYRRALLGDNGRALRVLDAAAAAIDWPTPRKPGVGKGLAMLAAWDTIVAHAIEVSLIGDRLSVTRIVVAADLGTVINPNLARGQFEGGSLMGLSAALGEAVTIKAGAAVERNFDTYRLLRMRQVPIVEVILLETPDAKVGGAGEPPVPGVAPALANAVFAASGRRIRKLPLAASGLVV